MIKEPFIIPFDSIIGETFKERTTSRHLSKMQDIFLDVAETEKMVQKDDVKVYDFTELGFQEVEQDLLLGSGIVYIKRKITEANKPLTSVVQKYRQGLERVVA